MITDEELGKGLLTLKVIWFAMLVSLAIYLFVGLQVATNLQVSLNKDTFAVLKWVFYALAFVTLIITRYIRRLILSARGQNRPATQRYQHPVIQKYATAMIIAWALSESIGIYGLVLFFLGKNTTDLYLLILISAAAMLMYPPSKDEIISLSEAATTGGAAA
jgi:F0F1-type ATP synthase membrane subunit c/vacuolar-type H+-ATPase subunit K